MDKQRYEETLHLAKQAELEGSIAVAITYLDRAARMTSDGDERTHLRIWRSRLAKQHEFETKNKRVR